MVKRKLTSEYKLFRQQVTWVEYAVWWVIRFILLFAFINSVRQERSEVTILQLGAELGISFLLPLLHLLPKSIFLARINYRVQDVLVVMLLVTAYFGQYKGFYSTVEWYDFYLHIIGCFVFVYAGYELTMALKRDDLPLAPIVAAMCGFGLSFFFAVGWEIFEFFCDSYFPGSNSQNWTNMNSQQLMTLLPLVDPQRYALLDTMSDLVAGTIGSLLGGIALYPYVYFTNKKTSGLTLLENNSQFVKAKAQQKQQRPQKQQRQRRVG